MRVPHFVPLLHVHRRKEEREPERHGVVKHLDRPDPQSSFRRRLKKGPCTYDVHAKGGGGSRIPKILRKSYVHSPKGKIHPPRTGRGERMKEWLSVGRHCQRAATGGGGCPENQQTSVAYDRGPRTKIEPIFCAYH